VKDDPPVLQGCIVAVSIVALGVLCLMDFSMAYGWITFIPNRISRMTVNWSGVWMMVLCLLLTAGFAHSFWSWLWRGTGRAEPWRKKWTATGITVVVLMFVSGMAVTGVDQQVRQLLEPQKRTLGIRNANRALHALEMIMMAQGTFQRNDLDDNKINDYWRKDIAGLHRFKAGSPPYDLIDLDIAAADDRRKTDLGPDVKFSPHFGYVFHTLMHEDEKEPSPNWWAACAIPVDPSLGPVMLIVARDGVFYQKPYSGQAPARYPRTPAADGWTEVSD